ncbi:MAG: DUF3990 domain-containing protein [Gammaproteobacteria bacterium]|nr:DUF3990 domain-containing protein [Gammaproteobacteria bacterium]
MNVSKELLVIRELLNLTQEELAKKLDVSFETINRWELEKHDVEIRNVERIYSFAYSKGIYLNSIYEQLLVEEYSNDQIKVLFHGGKFDDISFPIDLNHSKATNDFGKGFYLGENFKQAATYISNNSNHYVYVFTLDTSKLSIYKFDVTTEWMIAIAYYRGGIDKYSSSLYLQSIIKEIEKHDIIIAPIADNKMFDIIAEFTRGEITDLQCKHALAATNLGFQYVLRTEKAIERLKLLRVSFVSKPEKNELIKARLDSNNISQDKVKVARIEFRGKGKYIDEVLK